MGAEIIGGGIMGEFTLTKDDYGTFETDLNPSWVRRKSSLTMLCDVYVGRRDLFIMIEILDLDI